MESRLTTLASFVTTDVYLKTDASKAVYSALSPRAVSGRQVAPELRDSCSSLPEPSCRPDTPLRAAGPPVAVTLGTAWTLSRFSLLRFGAGKCRPLSGSGSEGSAEVPAESLSGSEA